MCFGKTRKTNTCALLLILMTGSTCFGDTDHLCGTEPAHKDLIDFSVDRVEIHSLGAKVSTDNGTRLTFPKANCGVMIPIPKDKQDLSGYAAVAIDIHNISSKPVTLIGELNGNGWANSVLHLKAGQNGSMKIHLLRKQLEDKRNEMFTGMRGIPGGYMEHWAVVNTRKIETVALHDLDGVSKGLEIELITIRAIGLYGELSEEKAKNYFPFVDQFGQFKHENWEGKVHSVNDLKKHREIEASDLIKHSGPKGWSQYGGWKDGPKLKATGHFRVEKHQGKWWFVDPEGYLFWSHGIDCVRFGARTSTLKREGYFDQLPQGYVSRNDIDFAQANQSAKYGQGWEQSVIEQAHRRLRSWGMNTVGNWSDSKCFQQGRTPYVVAINYRWDKNKLGELLEDPKRLRNLVRERMQAEKDSTGIDPWCIGYFVDNEIHWQQGWDAEVYYQVVSEEVKKATPRKLYMGSRLHGHNEVYGSKEHIVAAAAKYCDVIGINRYRFSPSDLRMVEGVDKPLLIGEFHFGALDRGMIHPGLRGLSDQQQRGYAYEHYLREALKHPHIVGTHWFQYREQNITGRFDGENYQIGFVDICDTPYQEIIAASRRIGYQMYVIRKSQIE